ncbi:hypothetical protein M408DRAFT_331486 [Serendipita vermifera MAFF 305830]|uniref:Uncharacterized protein n=1 Tax=Serendipita vermifera MAFF 305830 TaxID=933852 RepID=A0A0C2WF04_SERVB|nr:hypothetical protein M408DRAFT_331486 [Serendipita vermifera MAFF 305830]
MNLSRGLFDFLASFTTDNSDLGSSLISESQLRCPRLVKLQLDLKGGSAPHNQKTKIAAKRAAKVRIKAGIPIEKWLVRTPDDPRD